jgi:dienelactone hydrolase
MKFWESLRTHSALNAAPLAGKARFPLLTFSPGLGISRINYTAIVEQLASYGYIVAAIDHPYEGLTVLPDGRVLTADDDPGNAEESQMPSHLDQMVLDAKFVIAQLSVPATSSLGFNRVIDFKAVGMLGHSLGGAAALQACLTDAQFKACADLDGAPFGKVLEQGAGKPTLLLLEDPDYSDADLAAKGRTRAQWEEVGKKGIAMWAAVGKNKSVPVYKVKIHGTGHLSFSDAPFVMPDTITRFGGHILPPQEAYQQVTEYLLAFFDRYLKGKPSALLAKGQTM